MKSLKKDIQKDSRNFMYKYFVNFINYYQPPFFVMENVDNLAKKAIFFEIIRELQSGLPEHKSTYPGYKISYEVLSASDYGVPQCRKRLVRDFQKIKYTKALYKNNNRSHTEGGWGRGQPKADPFPTPPFL